MTAHEMCNLPIGTLFVCDADYQSLQFVCGIIVENKIDIFSILWLTWNKVAEFNKSEFLAFKGWEANYSVVV